MLSLGAFAFAAPGMLALLVALPAIYFLLRLIPPLPKLVRFPAIRLLVGLEPAEQTPMKMPWWLLLLRLLLATALILAVARPLLNPQADLPGRGPLLLVIDDGWSSAPGSSRCNASCSLRTPSFTMSTAILSAACAVRLPLRVCSIHSLPRSTVNSMSCMSV